MMALNPLNPLDQMSYEFLLFIYEHCKGHDDWLGFVGASFNQAIKAALKRKIEKLQTQGRIVYVPPDL